MRLGLTSIRMEFATISGVSAGPAAFLLPISGAISVSAWSASGLDPQEDFSGKECQKRQEPSQRGPDHAGDIQNMVSILENDLIQIC